jgi:GWxTD domain-containing protein
MIATLLFYISLILSSPAEGVQDQQMPEEYKKWIEEEVVYIISEREREIFYQLQNNDQRDRFIEEFWKVRDPSPGSKKNEFKEEHYRRIDYANKWLGRETAKAGWRTDRGKFYILLGEPEQKTAYYSHQKLMPMEIWFYQADPKLGVPPFFYMIFFKRYSVGDYILYDPSLHGPEQLIWLNAGQAAENAPMAIAEWDMELAQASVSLVPTEPADIENYRGRPQLSSIQLMSQLENIPNYRRDPGYAERILAGQEQVRTNFTFESMDLRTNIQVMRMPNGIPVLNYSFFYPSDTLDLGQYEDTVYAAIDAVISVMTDDGRQVLTDTITLDQDLNEAQKSRLEAGGYYFEDNKVIMPGTFNVTLTVRNNVSRTFFTDTKKITVPFRSNDSLQILTPTIYDSSSTGSPMDPGAIPPYKFDRLKYKPLMSDNVTQGSTVGVFYQVVSPIEEIADPLKIDYKVKAEDGTVQHEQTVWIGPQQHDKYGTASVVWQFDTTDFPTARKYQLDITASRGEESTTLSTPQFNLTKNTPSLPGLNRMGTPLDFLGTDVYVTQATLLRNFGRSDIAERLLAEIIGNFQVEKELHGTYASLLLENGKGEEAIEVLEKVLIRFPENSEFRQLLAMQLLRNEQYTKAIGQFERLRLETGDSPDVLNPLGEAYMLSGKKDKAREIWKRSLEIVAEQPSIKEKLEH